MPISINHSCVFIHVPRTGGTTIEKILGIHKDWPTLFIDVFQGRLESEGNILELQHLPYEEMKSIANIRYTEDFFKFTFVRNPWDRLVSEYSTLNQRDKNFFTQFVTRTAQIVNKSSKIKGENCHLRPQIEFISDDLDFVGRFENYIEDVENVLRRLGVDCQRIPQYGQTDHQNYTSFYDVQTIELVAEIYKDDIRLFGYEFGQ